MKSMLKKELADAAGVSVKTLMTWLEPQRQELERLGMRPNAKLQPPKVVKYIVEVLSLEL